MSPVIPDKGLPDSRVVHDSLTQQQAASQTITVNDKLITCYAQRKVTVKLKGDLLFCGFPRWLSGKEPA